MKLYYSGAKTPYQPQPRPEKSLGGAISNSAVSNGRANNLFSDASAVGLQEGGTELICLFLKNEGPTVYNLYLGCLLPALSSTTVQVAVVAVDSFAPQVELLDSRGDTPYVGDFHDLLITDANLQMATNGAGFIAAEFISGGILGIWVRRKLGNALRNPTVDESEFLLFKAGGYQNTYADAPVEQLQILLEYGNGL